MTKNERDIKAKRNTIKFPYYQDLNKRMASFYCLLTTNECSMKILQI